MAQQRVENGFELLELIKIAEAYKAAPSLSFDLNYTLADSTVPGEPFESIYGSAKINEGRYWTMLDDVVFVQGQEHNLTIYHADSMIVVNEMSEYGEIFKLPVLDSLFRDAHIDSIHVQQIDDTSRVINFFFNAQSGYSKYKLYFHKFNYRIKKLEYYVKNLPSNDGTTVLTGLVTVNVSNYSTTAFSNEIFREDTYIYKQNGDVYARGAFLGYKVLNNLVVQTPPTPPNDDN